MIKTGEGRKFGIGRWKTETFHYRIKLLPIQ